MLHKKSADQGRFKNMPGHILWNVVMNHFIDKQMIQEYAIYMIQYYFHLLATDFQSDIPGSTSESASPTSSSIGIGFRMKI